MQSLPTWIPSAALFGSLLVSAAAQTPSVPPAHPTTESAPQAQTGASPVINDDLQKMRVILNQMRNNLAFVGNTTTPLAHQFQLDIDMWQALLDHMQQQQEQKPPR